MRLRSALSCATCCGLLELSSADHCRVELRLQRGAALLGTERHDAQRICLGVERIEMSSFVEDELASSMRFETIKKVFNHVSKNAIND